MQWIGNCSHLQLDVHIQLIHYGGRASWYFKSLFKNKIASSRTQCFSFADTVCSQVLAAAPQTNAGMVPMTGIARPKTSRQRSWRGKHISVALGPAKAHRGLGSIRLQSPPGPAQPEAGGAACSGSARRTQHLAPRNRKQESRRISRENQKKPPPKTPVSV